MFRFDLIKKFGWSSIKLNQRELNNLVVDNEITKKIEAETEPVIYPEVVLMSPHKSFRTTALHLERAELTLGDSLPLEIVRQKTFEVAVIRKLKGQKKQQILVRGRVESWTTPFTKIKLEGMSMDEYHKLKEILNLELATSVEAS